MSDKEIKNAQKTGWLVHFTTSLAETADRLLPMKPLWWVVEAEPAQFSELGVHFVSGLVWIKEQTPFALENRRQKGLQSPRCSHLPMTAFLKPKWQFQF